MFNDQNSVENFVRDQLCAGDVGSRRREDNEGREARRTRSTKGAAGVSRIAWYCRTRMIP